MNNFINFIAFQIIWFIAILGAANSIQWPAFIAVGLFCAWQLSPNRRQPHDMTLILLALFIGFIIDGIYQAAGLIEYQLAIPYSPPFWILLLWISFALVINHSLAWLKKEPWYPVVFGLIGAPMSYYAGFRLGSVNFPNGFAVCSIYISISWAFVVYFLTNFEKLFIKKIELS